MSDLLVAIKAEEPKQEAPGVIDLEFPFGRPEAIDWITINPICHALLKEVNIKPWMKSTEIRPGFIDPSIDVYHELHELDLQFVRGVLPDVQFRRIKSAFREDCIARFFLNVNVYNMVPFIQWIRLLSTTLLSKMGNGMNPLVVRLNPLRPGLNYSLYWDYWSAEEQQLIHDIALKTLQQVPV